MYHKIKQSLISFFLFLLAFSASSTLFLSLLPTPSHADIGQIIDLIKKNKTIQDYGKEFCDKRNGELMNLETWFSGKCGKDVDTLSGEGVGFVDIITLQGIEAVIGPQQEGLFAQLGKILLQLRDIKATLLGQGNQAEKMIKLSEINKQHDHNDPLSQAVNATTFLLKTKPASSLDYIAYVSSNLKDHKIVKNTFAASPGYGFTSLTPILPVWRAFRNIAYILFALAFVIYGIMIMFRIRIDSKTAATIQLAIPKLIGTLLLITFSYAIVGLLIDLSTVATGLGLSVLATGKILKMDTWSTSLATIVGGVHGGFLGGIGSMVINTTVALIISPFIVISFIFAPYAKVFGAVVGIIGILQGWGIIIGVVLFLAILWSYFKLILKLFQSFLSVIISLIFSPIILLGNILPGSSAFQSWIMGLIGNLAVFPAAVFLLVLSYALMVQPLFPILEFLSGPIGIPGVATISLDLASILGVEKLANSESLWSPPLTFSFGAGIEGDIMLGVIGIGLLLMSSKYVDMVLEALKVPPFKYGAAIGEALKYGYNTAGDKNSWWRQTTAGAGLQGAAKGLYGSDPFVDASRSFGKPKSTGLF